MMTTRSTVDEIRERFDRDVDRFSNLDTGQSATIDAPLVMDLVAATAAAATPGATRALDIGCGAGNYSLKLLERLPGLEIDLLDLSQPMLDRAVARVSAAEGRIGRVLRGDVREVAIGEGRHDLVVASAVLHHLRSDAEWEEVFAKIHRTLRPGGSFWIADLIEHSSPSVQRVMWERYDEYLVGFGGEAYRDQIFAYVAREDSPRPLLWQLDLLRRTGFVSVDVLHKNSVFAAFGGLKRE
jgi:tRNA (cmo5U34)-methyltransferase